MNGGYEIHVQINDKVKSFDAWKTQVRCNPTEEWPSNSRLSHED